MQPDDRGGDAAGATAGTDATSIDADEQGDTESGATPTVGDDERGDVVELNAGEQVEDAVGNLVAVYDVAAWPGPFDGLDPAERSMFPFVASIDPAIVADHRVFAIDVGMCAAGLGGGDGGTVDFYLHGDPAEPVSASDALNRAAFGTEPVVSPGFVLPGPAECSRGWLPAYWDRPDAPLTVRYVLTTAAPAGAEPELHVYEWKVAAEGAGAAPTPEPAFGVGQTVTFNAGPLQDSTITLEGWTELIDEAAPLDGTRLVGVSIEVCPAGPIWPVLGLAVDGWNLVAPIDPADHLDAVDDGSARGCTAGWVEFAVPFGATPTGFTASDGSDFVAGFAEWSLADAALPTPR